MTTARIQGVSADALGELADRAVTLMVGARIWIAILLVIDFALTAATPLSARTGLLGLLTTAMTFALGRVLYPAAVRAERRATPLARMAGGVGGFVGYSFLAGVLSIVVCGITAAPALVAGSYLGITSPAGIATVAILAIPAAVVACATIAWSVQLQVVAAIGIDAPLRTAGAIALNGRSRLATILIGFASVGVPAVVGGLLQLYFEKSPLAGSIAEIPLFFLRVFVIAICVARYAAFESTSATSTATPESIEP